MGDTQEDKNLDSLQPLTVAAEGIDDDAAAMKKGQGRMILAVVAGLVVLGGGFTILMQGVDEAREFSEASDALTNLKRQHFDKFWGCAFEGTDLSKLKTDDDVSIQVHLRAKTDRFGYGRHMRIRCSEILNQLGATIDALQLPKELNADKSVMKKSTIQMRKAWDKYIEYLLDTDQEYSDEGAKSYLKNIVQSWSEFNRGHDDLNLKIQERLQ